MSVSETTLNNWYYKESGTSQWKSSVSGAAVTQIHADLLANNEIPDPFIDMNEKDIQWIGERDWEYKLDFLYTGNQHKNELVFEGLDTYATVTLNGGEILQSDNMFREYRVDVTNLLKPSNELHIVFKSAIITSRAIEKEKGKLVCFNGETSRLHVRKAQYHYGWDWGPVLITCGPWRPVKLVSYESVITDVYAKGIVDDNLTAKFDIQVEVAKGSDVSIEVEIKTPSGELYETKKTEITQSGVTSILLDIHNSELWYPIGYGDASLYQITTKLISNSNEIIQTISKKVGLRRVELIQEPFEDQEGSSFYIRVNNIPIYCVGSNWIPAHSISTLLTNDDYIKWLQLTIDGHQNMIRVWAGGYYEEEIFYSECDRLGLMVWQDFMFACGQYPGDKEFIASIVEETKTQLKRLRNHCSLAIYAGNNEDYQVAEQFNLEWDPKEILDDYSHTTFPARTIYEITLPKLVAEYNNDVPYHPGSPWGGSFSADPTIGDMHQWNVWHGNQEKYQDWYKLGGRFISEFGMEALPNRKTFEACITDKSELYPQSETVDHHNKADGFERRLALYVMENIKVTGMDLDSWIYASQLMQSECLAYAYRCWRREWRGDGKRYTSGAIVWQINDCWPVTSWAIVDYYRRPKLAFYAVKRESKPVWLGMYRNEKKDTPQEVLPVSKDGPPHDYTKAEYDVDIWGVNATVFEKKAILKTDIYDVKTGEIIEASKDRNVTLKPNQSTEFVANMSIPNDRHVVVYTRLVSLDTNEVIARASDWPQPLKYLSFPNRHVTCEIISDGLIKLSTNKPVKGVEILIDDDNIFLDDNGADLFPGDDQVIKARNLTKATKFSIRYYQKE